MCFSHDLCSATSIKAILLQHHDESGELQQREKELCAPIGHRPLGSQASGRSRIHQMMRDTLRRALWTTLAAWGAYLVLRWLGAPSEFALIGSGGVIAVSHWWSGAWSLSQAAADPVSVNTPDEQLVRLNQAAFEAAMEVGIALPRIYVSGSMNRYIFASGRSRYNPAVCVHTDLLADGYSEVLTVALRSELGKAKMNTPMHGTWWAICGTFPLHFISWW